MSILPHLDYCSSVWNERDVTLSDKLQKLQDRAARVITRSSYERVPVSSKMGSTDLSTRGKNVFYHQLNTSHLTCNRKAHMQNNLQYRDFT